MQRFGEKLRRLRKQKGLTLQELAHELGFTTHSYLSKVERGRKIPTSQLILDVSRFFNVSSDQLIKDELEVDDELPANQKESAN
jgi:transcriptional regulator with XRE-family HTH domain